MKRQRGRGRKPGGGGNQPNRALESNGPDTKVRGTAAYIYERYLQLARDASSSGDRVIAENYLQHAEHYFRILRAMQPANPVVMNNDRMSGEADDGEETGDQGAEADASGGDAGDTESNESSGAQSEGQQGDGDFRRRRGRRGRYRQNGDGEQRAPRADGEAESEAAAPAPRRSRERNRASADESGDGGDEGFSSGPTPAFLGSE